MTQEAFESTVRALMRRTPFQPFTIELVEGDRIEVDAPGSMAWGGGTAGYLNENGEAKMFDCAEVQQIITHATETAS